MFIPTEINGLDRYDLRFFTHFHYFGFCTGKDERKRKRWLGISIWKNVWFKTVETIVGEVVKVEKITPAKGLSTGVHLIVKTPKETISVHLGPSWFIDNQDINIKSNDKIEVKGSRINFEGKPAIIAAQVKKGNDSLELRNENGIPMWSGWRQR